MTTQQKIKEMAKKIKADLMARTTPRPNCRHCKVAQSVGRVIWCACMTEKI